MNKNKSLFTLLCSAIAIFGIAEVAALADTETIGAKVMTSTNPCAGKYYAYVKMTNSTGSTWVQPPTNTVINSGTLTDLSGLPSPYSSSAVVEVFGSTNYLCGSNSITFPATNTCRYMLMIVVTSATPSLTNGQPMNVQIQWQ